MKLTLRIEYLTGEAVEVVASAPDLVAFEQKFEVAITSLESNFKLTYLLWLAWHSLHRKKVTVLDFEAWVETVENVAQSEIDPKSKG